MTARKGKKRTWVYVEFAFDARVAHYYGQVDADLFEPLLRREVRPMVALFHPYWYSEEDALLSGRDYQGADVLYFNPEHIAFLAKVEPGTRPMKDIEIAMSMGDLGLHRMETN